MKITFLTAAICVMAFATKAQVASALDLDGSDHIKISSNTSMHLSKFTIETWLKWGRSGTAIDFVCGKGLEQLEIHTGGGASNNIRFIPTTGVYFDGGLDAITPGTWIHLACVYDPSIGLAKMYVNGLEVALQQSGANPITSAVVANDNDLSLGMRSDGSFPFLGQLDEFRLWNRALSQVEIKSKMNCEIVSDAYGLVINYHFNQGIAAGNNTQQTRLLDASTNVNNGSLIGFNLTGNLSNWISPGAITNGSSCAISGKAYGCQSATLTASGGVSYLWSGGIDTSAEINNFTASGLYTVTIVADNMSRSIAAEYISVSSVPSAPIASNQTFCGIITTNNLTADGTNLKWYNTSMGGSYIGNNTTFIGTNTFYVSRNLDGCESNRTQVVAFAKPIPASPTVAGVQSFCGPATVANLTANGQNLQWYSSQNYSSIYLSTEEIYTDRYYVTQNIQGCISTFGAADVYQPSIEPEVELAYAPSNTINEGEKITFVADIWGGGPAPSFQWYINTSLVGSNSNTFISENLKNNDVIKCVVTANNTCQITNTAFDFTTISVRQNSANNFKHTSNIEFQDGLTDITFGNDGRIFIAEYYKNRIAVWTQTGNNTFAEITTFGADGYMQSPSQIEIANGYIYVNEYAGHRIGVWTQSGNNFTKVATFGSEGNAINEFNYPSSVKVAQNGNILVCDYRNNRISIWTQTGNTFGVLTTFGGPSLMTYPFGLEIDANNAIFITERNKNRISVWTQSGNNFGIATTFGGYGSGLNQLNDPFGIHIATDGKIYITETSNYRVSVWTQSGNNFGNYATFGDASYTDYGFGRANGLYVGANQKVYVADENRNRLSIWEPCFLPSTIVTQPQSQAVCNGANAKFTVSALGINNVYQWSNTNTATTIAGITTSGIGDYNVEVVGCGKFVSNYASLSNYKDTEILTNPTSKTVCEGNFVIFEVSATGNNLTYLWNNGLSTTTSILTSTAGTNYTVTVLGTCSKAISTPTTLTVNALTRIATQPISKSVCESNFITFEVSATGNNLTYLWNNGLSTTTSILTSTAGTNYTVTVLGTCGKAISTLTTLTVNALTRIATQPISQTILPNATANVSVSATGVDLRYTWSSNETVAAIINKPAGTYSVTVSGTCGTVISNAATITGMASVPGFAISTASVLGISTFGNIISITSPINITINGTGFAQGATITIQGIALNVVSITPTNMVATLTVGVITNTGAVQVKVQNPNQLASEIVRIVPKDVTPTSANLPTYQSTNFSIYPNPAVNGEWKMENAELNATMYVYNTQGMVVYSQKIISETTQINANLISGIYVVKIGNQFKKLILK